jgi:hypothetical protein
VPTEDFALALSSRLVQSEGTFEPSEGSIEEVSVS